MKFILCLLIILVSFISGAVVYRSCILDKIAEVCEEFHENLKTNEESDEIIVYSVGAFDTLARIAEELGVDMSDYYEEEHNE